MPRDKSDEKAELDLLELIKQRDELAETLKFAPPGKIAEGQALLRETDAKIEEFEAAIAKVQEAVAAEDAALDARRQKAIGLLPVLDGVEKEMTRINNEEALKQIAKTRDLTFKFLREDAEERGIPNDDH